MLQTQWSHWKEFRQVQDWRRRMHQDKQSFKKHALTVSEYRKKKGLVGDIRLSLDRAKQSKLEDWKEYQVWELEKADRLERKLRSATQHKEASRARLQSARDSGHPPEKLRWIEEQGVKAHEARRGTAEIALSRQAVLLSWIAERLLAIASECSCSSSGNVVTPADTDISRSNFIRPWKRKRTLEDDVCSSDNGQGASASHAAAGDRTNVHDDTASCSMSTHTRHISPTKRRCGPTSSVEGPDTCGGTPLVSDVSRTQPKPDRRFDRTSQGQRLDKLAPKQDHTRPFRIQPSRRVKSEAATYAPKHRKRQALPSSCISQAQSRKDRMTRAKDISQQCEIPFKLPKSRYALMPQKPLNDRGLRRSSRLRRAPIL